MGNSLCGHSAPSLHDRVSYSGQISLKISEKDFFGRQTGSHRVTFEVTPPINRTQWVQIGGKSVRVTASCLPSLDPQARTTKDCQDSFFLLSQRGTLLAGVFDGHGTEGKAVAQFCCTFMQTQFALWFDKLVRDPMQGLEALVERCDQALCQSEIDTCLSGSAAAIVFIIYNTAYIANLGDSRAVLGKPATALSKIDQPEQTKNPYVRPVLAHTCKDAVALTTDQRPDCSGEYERILTAGGRVAQLVDKHGKSVGPYRVWAKAQNLPGLAISRSLGNSVATRLGVIATPVVTEYNLEGSDFIVVATNGVWAVMNNREVVDFTETFRKKTTDFASQTYPVTVSAYAG